MQADGTKGATVAVSHNPDFTSLHEVGSKVFMLSHFEAPYPGGMYLTELDAAKAAQGVLTPLSFKVGSSRSSCFCESDCGRSRRSAEHAACRWMHTWCGGEALTLPPMCCLAAR